jgi:phosphoglycolate phosphatase
MGRSPPPLEELIRNIGPPLRHYFAEVLGAEKVEEAIAHYRQRYDYEGKCLTENTVYPAIPSVLTTLQQHGKKLFVVTAKPQVIAEKIMKHFGLDNLFQHVYGAELDETRSDKAELIAYILEREKLLPETIVMVGDRKHDIIGAAKNKIRSIGVLWGYGSVDELQSAGATTIVQYPDDLLTILLDSKP